MPVTPAQPRSSGSPTSPWALVDDNTIGQTAGLLEKLTTWLLDAPPLHTASLAQAISGGDTDAEGIAYWVHALAARLRRCAEAAEL